MQASEVKIDLLKDEALLANLSMPEKPRGLVIFAHGNASSRMSSRNRFVAGILEEIGLCTLMAGLLTPAEDLLYKNRFNIPLLSRRLIRITEWCMQHSVLRALPMGYFAASTGAASALHASALLPEIVHAVVCRGGRPDLTKCLTCVKSPTLFIIGSLDKQVIDLNEQALHILDCTKKMEIVKGASHLFEEPGTLHKVAHLAADWFNKYLLAKTHS